LSKNESSRAVIVAEKGKLEVREYEDKSATIYTEVPKIDVGHEGCGASDSGLHRQASASNSCWPVKFLVKSNIEENFGTLALDTIPQD